MEKKALDKVCKTVYQRFPIFKTSKPRVSKQGDDRYLILFSVSANAVDGRAIQQSIRVVASDDGKILKTSMSK